MRNVTPRPRYARSPLVVGVVLLLIGAGLLATNLGLYIPIEIWRFWPLVLIIPGCVAIVAPSRHMSRSGGIWLVAVGAYAELSIYRLFGLSWFSAWPIFVIAAGLSMIFDQRERNTGATG